MKKEIEENDEKEKIINEIIELRSKKRKSISSQSDVKSDVR